MILTPCFLLYSFLLFATDHDQFEVTFFDVGQGNCTLVRCPNGGPLLVDCGSSGGLTKKRKKSTTIQTKICDRLKEYIRGNTKNIINVLISHPDKDHFNWVADVLDNSNFSKTNIKIVLGGSYQFEENYQKIDASGPATYKKNFYNLLEKRNVECKYAYQTNIDTFFNLGNVSCKLLSTLETGDSNDISVVLKLSYNNYSFMLTGDATEVTTNHILEEHYVNEVLNTEDLRVTVLQASHHGADTEGSNNISWLRHTNPQCFILSTGIYKGYGHPNYSVVKRSIIFANLTTDEPLHKIQMYKVPEQVPCGSGKRA